jgi:hypothetical protein
MSAEVFISYAAKDRGRGLGLVKRLQDAGVTVWIDQAGIDVSTKSIQEIERARKAEPGTGTQAGQIRAMPGGGVIQPQSAISS